MPRYKATLLFNAENVADALDVVAWLSGLFDATAWQDEETREEMQLACPFIDEDTICENS